MQTFRHNQNQHRPRPRHGMSMLLVLISLMTATIVTVAYLSSRDNSALIGENVTETAKARWAANSGIDLAIATLQTEGALLNLPASGQLLQNYVISGGTLDVSLVDQLTGLPPTADSIYLVLTSTARVGPIEQTTRGQVEILPKPQTKLNLDLAEFAVFAADHLSMEDDSIVTRWPESPLSQLGQTISIGTQSTDTGRVRLRHRSASVDTEIYHRSGSDGVISNSSDHDVRQRGLDDTIPMPKSPPPDTGAAEAGGSSPGVIVFGSSGSISESRSFGGIQVQQNTGRLHISGDTTVLVENHLELMPRSGIEIAGNVTLVVKGNVKLNPESWIELIGSDSTLTMFVGGDYSQESAYVGNFRAAKNIRDTTGHADWYDIKRLNIFSIDDDVTDPLQWELSGNSLVKGSIYAPSSEIVLTDTSALYGRVASHRLLARLASSIYYDHALDSRHGYNYPGSLLFDEDGRIRQEVQDVEQLSSGLVQDLVDALGTTTDAVTGIIGRLLGFGGSSGTASTSSSTSDPTPRTVPVRYAIVAHGYDVSTWEISP